MEYITSLVWCCLEVIHCCTLSSAFLTSKRTAKQTIIIIAIFSLAQCLLAYASSALGITGLTIIGYVVLSFCLFRGSWLQHLLTACLCFVFNAIFDVAILYGASALLGISLSEFVWRKLAYITAVTLGKLISILIAWILCKLRMRRKAQRVQNKWLALTMLFPGVSVLMLIVIYISYRDNADMSIGAVIISFAVAAANVAVLYLLKKMEEQSAQEQALLLLNQQMEIQTKGIIALEKSYRAQRQATHEFQHHLQVLGDLLDNSHETQASNYLEKLQKTQAKRIFCVNSNHPIIDALLNQKYQFAKDEDIDMQIQVSDLSAVKIPDDMIVVLLSNLLDNAIEACKRISGERFIHCSIVQEESLFLSIKNSSAPVEIVDGNICTSKSNSDEHGFGLVNVRHILNQLSAEYTFSYEDGIFYFVAEIPTQNL